MTGTAATRDRPQREWMPATIIIPMFLSALLVLVWLGAGAVLLWLLTTFPTPANATSTILWGGLVVLGVLVNVAVLVGLARRISWLRWVVVGQALAMTALLIVTPIGLWAGAVGAGQGILLFVPSARRWFRGADDRRPAF
ncbi:hypothetical protein [Microbacterium sp. MYb62]|uniref:hypothetical protein n=1 Tax=Microbacterium sp. MYb62 TaxID=1848690 RepID=UPI0011B00767|nr:hypothetical protein [Microbacterium sp. MYb62]